MLARRTAICAAFAFLIAGSAFAQAAPSNKVPPIPANVRAAVDDQTRPEKDRARDAGRKPDQVFALAGIKTGDKVIEIGSFGQYDTNIIVRAIGPKGHVYMYDLPYQRAKQEEPTKTFNAEHPNTEYQIGKFDELTYPKDINLVVIDMYYHDLALPSNGVDMTKFNKQMFDALKKGGRVLIVDHNAEAGSGRRDTQKIHRIGPEVIEAEMKAAGFKEVVNSTIFANPDDDKTKMVFAPGERGSTDRSLFVFQK
jgi:predicted methyltransferase